MDNWFLDYFLDWDFNRHFSDNFNYLLLLNRDLFDDLNLYLSRYLDFSYHFNFTDNWDLNVNFFDHFLLNYYLSNDLLLYLNIYLSDDFLLYFNDNFFDDFDWFLDYHLHLYDFLDLGYDFDWNFNNI